ncbi:MAG TPA: phage tail protein [Sphingomicrobium sp.]
MAEVRDRPYGQNNFLVDFGEGTDGPQAGFQEVSGIGMEVTVAEYRAGNFKENSVLKVNTMNKSSDMTLKRGVCGSDNLYKWLHEVRNGNQDVRRPVTVTLMNEDHSSAVLIWKLKNARPIKWTAAALNAKGTDVAIEEMVLSYERLEMELG